MTMVFISYSHDSEAHRSFVRSIADRLCTEGVNCLIDQYINGFPPEGWQRWMENQIEAADFVLLVCTETYLRRYRGQETNGGKGVNFEGVVISQHLYDTYYRNTKFIPLIPAHGDYDHVPVPLKAYSTYRLPDEYDDVYRVLTGQAKYEQPKLGEIRQLGSKDRIYSNSLPTVEGKLFGREAELALLDTAWGKSLLSPLLQRGEPSSQTTEKIEGSPPLFSPSMGFTLRARSAREKSFPTIFCEKGEQGGFSTHIVQFIASGGTGKTKLLKHWLDNNTDSIEALIAWSFYSQGSSEDKQVSATPFFNHAFSILQSDKTSFATEEEKGEHLAHLLRQRRCLLVLDGLEPLQHAGRGMRGEVKDRAIRQLLKSLAGDFNSLCIITTRIAVHELSDRAHVISHDLQNLAVADGVALLKSWQVRGSDKELETAVREYGCHALALHLLGNALHSYLDGDVRKRDTLDELMGDYDAVERHAFKVMQAYQRWLVDEAGQPTAELQLLYLLGLFDHPVETEVLEVLWQAQIPGLTSQPRTFWQKLTGKRHKISKEERKQWQIAIRDLREKHRLLSAHEGRPELLDCHPLIREYFGGRLQAQQSEGWRLAHERLYAYYKALPEKELPDTVEEMQPLFSAVAHGCAVGLHQRALDEVYWPRVRRKQEAYIVKKLGAFSDDLATVAHFFTTPWQSPAAGLGEMWQAGVLNWAGFRLRAMGRLREALEPMQANIEMSVKQKNWKEAALGASNLSELQLTLGEVAAARDSGQRSVDYADQSGDMFMRMVSRTVHADALHQASEAEAALALLREAEQLQQELQPGYPRLYSLPGFRYCDLLLGFGCAQPAKVDEVLERAEQTLEWGKKQYSLLTRALDQLTLGRAHLQQLLSPSTASRERGPGGEGKTRSLSAAEGWLNQAVAGLRAAGAQEFLVRGLLARATLHRHTQNFPLARQDLQEVFDIANGSEMRLFLTDYHLEMARVLLAEEETPPNLPLSREEQDASATAVQEQSSPDKGRPGGVSFKEHVEAAARLIAETGYHRRNPELAALRQHLR